MWVQEWQKWMDGCLPIPVPIPPWLPPTGSPRLVSSRLAVIVLFQLFPCHSLLVLASNRPRDPERPRASGTSQGFSQLGARGGLLVSRRRFHRAVGDIAATEPYFSSSFLILLCPSPPGHPRPCSGDKVTRLSVLHANAELTRDLGPSGGKPQPFCWEQYHNTTVKYT